MRGEAAEMDFIENDLARFGDSEEAQGEGGESEENEEGTIKRIPAGGSFKHISILLEPFHRHWL